MGTGTDAARAAGATVHADVMDNFKDQLLLVLIRRLGGKVEIPVAECDDTGGLVLNMAVKDFPGEAAAFQFELEAKQ